MVFEFVTVPSVASSAPSRSLARRVRLAGTFVLLALIVVPARGQIPNLMTPQDTPQSSPTFSPEPPTDPLGRSTPRGTVTGFIRAAHRDDIVSAARYMEVTPRQKTDTEKLVRELKGVMDRYFMQPVATISDLPRGDLDDGLPLDRERVGPLTIGGQRVDIVLVHVDDSDTHSGPIWRISSETLSQVPALYETMEKSWIDRVMPKPLLEHTLLGARLSDWIAWIGSIGFPLMLLWLLSSISIFLVSRITRNPSRRLLLASWYDAIRYPIISLVTLITHLVLVRFLGFSLNFRIGYVRFGALLVVIATAWLLRRIITLAFDGARRSVERRRQNNAESLILLAERLIKALVILAAIFLVLTLSGVDSKTALAGLGIGGVALALGAQKTVENLLGGIILLTDKAIAVGDMCRISNRIGTIEDITLRSIRLRTLQQTLLCVPAGALSQANIENFATRNKMLIQTILQLQYGTNSEQLRTVLDALRRSLSQNPSLETETARVRLIDFGSHAIELELFAYVLTSDNAKFLAVREDLLLQVATIVESSGICFARPTQFVYGGPQSDHDDRANGVGGHEEPQLLARSLNSKLEPEMDSKAITNRSS